MLEINKIHQGDCLEVMKQIDDKSVDMILCDLPYGVTARNKWDKIINTKELFKEYRRIIKEKGIICLTATQPFATELILKELDMFRYDLIWEKSWGTGFLNANRMPLRSHELVLIFYKKLGTYNPQKEEGKPYKMMRRNDTPCYGEKYKVFVETDNKDGKRFPKSILKFSYDKKRGLHPTQKPVALFEYLIKTYTNEGDLVLDNCMGSGTTAVACINTKRNFIGIELNPEYCEIANKRIDELTSKQEEIE
jgi:site-specific DNA-methyltransferase (adenine-specific)